MKTRIIILLMPLLSLFQPDQIFAQLTIANYDGAKIIERGKMEIGSNYTSFELYHSKQSIGITNNIGLRVGFGITKFFDLKFQYNNFFHRQYLNYHSLQLIPKFSDPNGLVAFSMPIGVFIYNWSNLKDPEGATYYISPRIIGTIPIARVMELNLTPLVDILLHSEETQYMIGFNLGTGFSSDFSTWAIRYEFGLSHLLGGDGFIWNTGLGFSYRIKLKKDN